MKTFMTTTEMLGGRSMPLRETNPKIRRTSAKTLPGFLRPFHREEEVRRVVLDDLGSCYLAEVDGWTYRGWLEAVADRVDEVLRSGGR